MVWVVKDISCKRGVLIEGKNKKASIGGEDKLLDFFLVGDFFY